MGNLNFNNLFIGISREQIIVLAVLVVLSVLFGLMAGASIFYPLGYRRCRKDGKAGVTSSGVMQDAFAAVVATKQQDVPDTFDTDTSYEYSDDDLFNFIDEEEQAAPEQKEIAQPAVKDEIKVEPKQAVVQEIIEETVQAVKEEPETERQAVPVEEKAQESEASIVDETTVIPALMDIAPGTGEQIQVTGVPLRDDAFVRMEEHRKQLVPIINRSVMLSYCARMTPLANALPIRVATQDARHPYDRILVKDFTFALVFEHNKVLRLVLRLHANTIGALRHAAGNTVLAEEAFGQDWYGWVITDIEHCEKVVAKVLDMSYKYVAHASYMRGKEGGFVEKVEPYEDEIIAKADAYNPAGDAVFTALAERMNAKYQLHYFGKREAAQFARSIKGDLDVTVEDANSSTAILKADGVMFAVVYESYGVVKLLFRADKDYVDALHDKHQYVGCSEVPKSQYRQWYYAILDKSFDDADCQEIITTAYQHVAAQK